MEASCFRSETADCSVRVIQERWPRVGCQELAGRAVSLDLERQKAWKENIPKISQSDQKKSSSLDWGIEGNVALRSLVKCNI